MIDRNDRDDSPGGSSHHTLFDPELDSVSEELVIALTTMSDADPTDMEPLSDSVDPGALDRLFTARPNSRSSDSDIAVEFEYSSHIVVVRNDGTITICPETATDD